LRSRVLVRASLILALALAGVGSVVAQEAPADAGPARPKLEALEKAYEAANKALFRAQNERDATEAGLAAADSSVAPLNSNVARVKAIYPEGHPEVAKAQQLVRAKIEELGVGQLMRRHDQALTDLPNAREEVVRSGWALVGKYFETVDRILEMQGPVRRQQIDEYVTKAGKVLADLALQRAIPRTAAPPPNLGGIAESDPNHLDEQIEQLQRDCVRCQKEAAALEAELVNQYEDERRLKRLVRDGEQSIAERAQQMLDRDVKPRIAQLQAQSADARGRAVSANAEADRMREHRDRLLNPGSVAPTTPSAPGGK
jgi:hypothetical protein